MADVINTSINYTLPECTFTPPENKEFYKWQISETLYDAGDKVKLTDDTVIKAVWRGIPDTVTPGDVDLDGFVTDKDAAMVH